MPFHYVLPGADYGAGRFKEGEVVELLEEQAMGHVSVTISKPYTTENGAHKAAERAGVEADEPEAPQAATQEGKANEKPAEPGNEPTGPVEARATARQAEAAQAPSRSADKSSATSGGASASNTVSKSGASVTGAKEGGNGKQ